MNVEKDLVYIIKEFVQIQYLIRFINVFRKINVTN